MQALRTIVPVFFRQIAIRDTHALGIHQNPFPPQCDLWPFTLFFRNAASDISSSCRTLDVSYHRYRIVPHASRRFTPRRVWNRSVLLFSCYFCGSSLIPVGQCRQSKNGSEGTSIDCERAGDKRPEIRTRRPPRSSSFFPASYFPKHRLLTHIEIIVAHFGPIPSRPTAGHSVAVRNELYV
jgi:hypothetical protein